jgi:tetratricopeptide (TPR) repeat protein
MIKPLAILVSIAAALLVLSNVARADDAVPRLALVIGNASYPDADAPLKEAVNDAHALADELKHDGFAVTTAENLGHEAMLQAFDKLYAAIKPRALVVVFFSGYGIQSGRQTFMIPIDAQIWTDNDIRRDGVGLDNVLDELNSRGAGVKLAILDASRRNPYERRFRAASIGLAPPASAPQNSLVMYSAAPGTVVDDATTSHGLFVDELLKEMRAPDLTADEALSRTARGVSHASDGVQVPWISSSLTEDFSFSGAATTFVPPNTNASNAGPPTSTTPSSSTQANNESQQPQIPQAPQIPQLPQQPQTPQQPQAPALTPDQLPYWANDEIVSALTDLMAKTPNDENLYYKRGQYFAGKGAYKLALADLDRAVTLNGKDAFALNNRCWVRAVVGDMQSALGDCNAALKLRPFFVDAFDSRGLVFLKLGFYPNALADFDAALKLNAKLASSLYGRGLARQQTGQPALAAADLQAAAQLDPDIAAEYKSWGVQ